MSFDKFLSNDDNTLFSRLFEFLLKEEDLYVDLVRIIEIVKQVKAIPEKKKRNVYLWGDKEARMQKWAKI